MLSINVRKSLILLVVFNLIFSAGSLWGQGSNDGEMVIPRIEPANLGSGKRLKVVASTSLIGDTVERVAGSSAEIDVLMPLGQNPHAYEPTPRAMITLEKSYVAFVNGLNLEEQLMETIKNVAGTYVVPVSAGIDLLGGGGAFEWAGAFELSAGEYVWTFAKVDGEYADPMMKMAMLSSDFSGTEAIEEQKEKAEELLESEDIAKKAHGDTLAKNENKAFQLVFDPDKNVTKFRIKIEKDGVYTFFTEHMPFEFEAYEHFLKDLARKDIEPIAQQPETGHDHAGGQAFEWAGVFELSAGKYKWTFAKVDGDYADPMMKMVMLSSNLSGIEAIEEQKEKAKGLLESDARMKKVHGDTLAKNDDKAFQLVFDPDRNVTEFIIDIEKQGVYAFFTEHMPFEFESDEHFLKDLARKDIEPIAQEPDAGHHHHHHDHSAGDPHFWYDPNNVIVWTQNIARVLSEADPANSSVYKANAEAYIAELKALDREIRQMVSSIPPNRRKLVEDHVALTYFADEYGFEIVGAVVPTVSDQAEPSARHIAQLAEVIRKEDAYLILIGGEVGRGMKNLANAIAEEVGRDVRIVTYLHGSLAPKGSRGDNYLDFMRYNTEQIVSALK